MAPNPQQHKPIAAAPLMTINIMLIWNMETSCPQSQVIKTIQLLNSYNTGYELTAQTLQFAKHF